MATTIVDPVARIEGHLKVKLEISGGVVTDARLTGNMYRGFENFLVGGLPIDAPLITQRVCGVCPTAHAVASGTCHRRCGQGSGTPQRQDHAET